jgi:hypothetical protein
MSIDIDFFPWLCIDMIYSEIKILFIFFVYIYINQYFFCCYSFLSIIYLIKNIRNILLFCFKYISLEINSRWIRFKLLKKISFIVLLSLHFNGDFVYVIISKALKWTQTKEEKRHKEKKLLMTTTTGFTA